MRQNPRQVKTFPLNLRPDGCITHGSGMAVGDKDLNVSRSWTFCVILQHVHCAEQNQNKSNIVLMWNLQNQQGKDSTFCLDLARARRQKNAQFWRQLVLPRVLYDISGVPELYLCPYTRVMAGLGGVRAGCQVGGGRGRAEKRLISALVLDTSVGIRFNSCRHCTDTTLLHSQPSLLAGQGSFENIWHRGK